MDFIDDHRLDRRQLVAIRRHRKHERERLRRGEQHVRRPRDHEPPLFDRRVARAYAGTYGLLANPAAANRRAIGIRAFEETHLAPRPAQVVFDVVTERAQRGDVQRDGARDEFVGVAQLRETAHHRQKCSERLPRSGRRADEDVAPVARERQRLRLRWGRRTEMLVAPARDERVKDRERPRRRRRRIGHHRFERAGRHSHSLRRRSTAKLSGFGGGRRRWRCSCRSSLASP